MTTPDVPSPNFPSQKEIIPVRRFLIALATTVASVVGVGFASETVASAAGTCDLTAHWAEGWGSYGHCIGTFPFNERFRVRVHCNGNPIRPSYDRWGPWVAQYSSRGAYLTSFASCDTSAGETLYSVAGETTFV